ncbi:nucleolar and coiled-body phosphoprotein 1 isoform X1 [Cloeon dipterum]|uniref:nucleolar and coiled-body phosphoprotein 1 isoform X1 n=2 Tax=Cloeon dipterum TaxID=197152 RepID=UPI003220493C
MQGLDAKTPAKLQQRLQGFLRSFEAPIRRYLAAQFTASSDDAPSARHMKAPDTTKEEQGPVAVGKTAGPAEESPVRRIALTASEDLPPRKSPVTVQEWVDSLPHPGEVPSSPVIQRRHEETSGEHADTLALGAEAELILRQTPPSIVVQGPQQAEEEVDCEVQLRRREAFKSGERVASFASDSAASNASSAGVESYLESRKPDPETILLNLGFGGSQDSANELGLSRIPQRFLQPSQVKGISINQFYNIERLQAETFETGFYGYRGLTGPSHKPSPIVAKIMERLRHHERSNSEGSVASAPAAPQTVPSTAATADPPDATTHRFARAAQKVQNSKSVLTRIQSWKSDSQNSSAASVLNADNRRFLEKQALSKSPDVPRRIIMGRRSYTFSGDDLIECNEMTASPPPAKVPQQPIRFPPPLVHKDSILSSTTSYSDDSDESEEDFRRRSFLKRTRPLTPPPELPPTIPVAASTPAKPPARMVSTSSFSSWESDSWLPSPPAGPKLAFSTFSSIDESSEQELLARAESQDGLRVKSSTEVATAAAAALAARRGSLKRQSRVSEEEEPSTSSGVATNPPDGVLSRTGSAQSDSSGFQEESANTVSHSVSPEETAEEHRSSGSASPVNAARLMELQDQASKSLETFRAQVLAETNPEKQALIQVKVDQISGVLLQLQSLCENFQEQEG